MNHIKFDQTIGIVRAIQKFRDGKNNSGTQRLPFIGNNFPKIYSD